MPASAVRSEPAGAPRVPGRPDVFVRLAALSGVAQKFCASVTPCPADLRLLTVDHFLAATSVHRHTWLSVSTSKQLRQCVAHHLKLSAASSLPADQVHALFVLLPAKLTHSVNAASCQLKLFHRFPPGSKPFIDGSATVLPPISAPLELWTSYRLPAQISAACMAANPSMLFNAKVCGDKAVALLDSGATRSFVSPRLVEALGLSTRPDACPITLADGSVTSAASCVAVTVRLHNCSSRVTALVMPLAESYDLILGDDWLCSNRVRLNPAERSCSIYCRGKWQLVHARQSDSMAAASSPAPVHCEPFSKLQFKKFARKHPNKCFAVFLRPGDSGPGVAAATPGVAPPAEPPDPVDTATAHCTEGVRRLVRQFSHLFKEKLPGLPPFRNVGTDVVIPLTPGARPVARPLIRLSRPEMEEVERQVTLLLEQGLIVPSSSAWGAPVLFAKKKDGSLRMVIGYHATVNPHTVRDSFPIPRIDQLLDEIAESRVFSSLDLCSAYHQVRLAPEDVEKTTFRTHLGAFAFLVLPFGVSNAPSAFQRVMAEVFRPLRKNVVLYLDDILIHARTHEEHESVLRQALQLLDQHQFYLGLRKCQFQMTEVNYLGHVIKDGAVRPDPKKTQSVADWPPPRNLAELRSFVGLATWFRKFIQGFSRLTLPLTTLTKQNAKWDWSADCQASFEGIKQALSSASVLALPAFDKPFTLVCDASDYGVGAVLMQDDRPIAYESRRFSPAELNYTVSEKEALAVVHALKIWRCYLESGQEVVLVTDHHPNTYMQNQVTLSRRQARWSEFMARFNFRWEYRPGRLNVADPLSRHPLLRPAPVMVMLAALVAAETRSKSTAKTAETPRKRGRTPSPEPAPAPAAPTPARRKRAPKPARKTADAPKRTSRARVRFQLPNDSLDQPTADAPEQQQSAEPPTSLADLPSFKAAYLSDPFFSDPKRTRKLTHVDGLWYKGGKLVIPDVPAIKRSILFELHDAPYSGHVGIDKTLAAVQRHYWWPGLAGFVTDYVRTCNSCQLNKASNRKPPGLLVPLPTPAAPWDSVSMDFIPALPLTASGHDCILVFVCRLTKMVHIVPTVTTVTAEQTAKLYRDHVWKHHGTQLSMISDRGPQFNSRFMSELARLLGTKQSLSTAFHPQTDGQTERVNRVLQDMLRHYVSSKRDDWDEHLAAAEFAINNADHASTGFSPFVLNYGRAPRVPFQAPVGQSRPADSAVKAVTELRARLESDLKQAKQLLNDAKSRQKFYADGKRSDASFKAGDLVLLNTRNIKLKGPASTKLMPKWLGPFKVETVINPVAYRLALPNTMRIHPTFHVSLLKPYQASGRVQPPPPPVIVDDEGGQWFSLESIRDHRITKRGRRQVRQYLVRWAGYGPEHDTWEPEENVAPSEMGETLRRYWAYLGQPLPKELE